jgi:SAM-dependent methyltransferase
MLPEDDHSAGYDALAAEFVEARSPSIGYSVVHEWARGLPEKAEVLELGCGHGVPVSQALMDAGVQLFVIDGSPNLLDLFRRRFPSIPSECCPVLGSTFFRRSFDGIIAWGLLFLLPPDTQCEVIAKAASALKPGGEFLFTAPSQECEWTDVLTGRTNVSLGRERYRSLLHGNGLSLLSEPVDSAGNHHYLAVKRT